MDYFSLFSLPESFLVDEKALEQAYFSLQRQYHPDRFTGKPPAERQAMLQQSITVNEAYQILKSPLKRAQYLLSLHGIRVGSEQDTVKPSPVLLMDVMEKREALVEAKDAGTLEALASQAENAYQGALQSLSGAFGAEDWEAAANYTLALSYYTKFREEVAQKRLLNR